MEMAATMFPDGETSHFMNGCSKSEYTLSGVKSLDLNKIRVESSDAVKILLPLRAHLMSLIAFSCSFLEKIRENEFVSYK